LFRKVYLRFRVLGFVGVVRRPSTGDQESMRNSSKPKNLLIF